MSFSGGCACGAVRYSCTAEPAYMGNCHCRDCQRATGSAYFAAIGIKASDFKLDSGELGWFEKPADRGHIVKRAFCAGCGSPILLINDANPEFRVLYAGSLDDPAIFQPMQDIYVASAQPWDHLDPDIPKYDRHFTRK